MSDDKTAIEDYLKKVQHDSDKIFKLLSWARIYKVPEGLRKLNESAYIPRIIAIGPLHRNEKHLQTPMRGIKRHYMSCLLDRVPKDGMTKSSLLKQYLDKMKEKKFGEKKFVDKVKEFYAEEFTVNDDDLLNKTNEKEFVDKAKKYYTEEVAVNAAAELNKTKEKEKEKKFVDKAKKYYDKEVMMTVNDDDMLEMMLEDGCFILEVLYASHTDGKSKIGVQQPVTGGEDGSSGDCETKMTDPILGIIWNRNFVKLDLLLLENQIPFFVLEELFELTIKKLEENRALTDYVLDYFREIMSPEFGNSGSNTKTGCSPSDCALWINRMASYQNSTGKEYYHILHLLHDSYQNSTGVPLTSPSRCPLLLPCCTPPKEKTTGKQFKELQISASDLDYAGVKFAVGPDGESNQFNIYFNEPQCIFRWLFCGAKFEIPTLDIQDSTESFFRNLIALEQCCPRVKPYFTSYAKLMDMLISSKEDVKVLKEKEVIRNHLGTDEDVADLFNKLCKEVVLEEFYFNDQCQDAYKYSQHNWPWFWAQFKRRYFKSPWGFIGFIVAFIAFGITVTNFIRNFLE